MASSPAPAEPAGVLAGAQARRPRPGLIAVLVFAVNLAVFVSLTPRFMALMGWPTGDEPYYLLTAHSLIHDHDFELTNNFDNQDYWHYYPGELYPRHEAKTVVPGLYSKHSLGVSLLILPVYAIDDWRGTIFFFNFLGALLAAQIYLLGYEVSGKHWIGLLLWLTMSFTNPLMSYSFLIFPALVSALCTVYAYRRIRLDGTTPPLSGNGPLRMLAIGACLGLLPWLHARFVPISLSLFAYLLWREYTARRRLPAPAGRAARRGLGLRVLAFLAPAALCAVLFVAYYWVLYGTPFANYGDHAGAGEPAEWVVAFFGSLFDRQWGFLIYAPVFALAGVGLLWMWRKARRELFWLAVIAIPYAAIILTYKQWWGEWCPAARYWVSLAPLLAVPLAYVLLHAGRALRLLYGALATVSWAIMAIFMWDPHLMYNHPTGESQLLDWLAQNLHLPSLQPLVPTYFVVDWSNVWLTVIYSELTLLVVWFGWKKLKDT